MWYNVSSTLPKGVNLAQEDDPPVLPIDAFVISCKADGLLPRSVEFHRYNLSLLDRFLGNRDPNTDLLRAFIADMFDRKLSAYTIRGRIRTLKKFFRWCANEEKIVDDPSRVLNLPRAPKRIPRGIEQTDFEKMLSACQSQRDRAILFFLRDTACRASELCKVRLQDIDWSSGKVSVIGKGGQEGFVFLSKQSREEIKKWMNERESNCDSLFVTSTGGNIRYSTIKELLRRLKKRACVTGKCSAHSFRHGFVRDYISSGGDLSSLSDLLRHKNIETTQIYATFSVTELQAKHDRLSPVETLKLRN
jgi:integrase/recombinase XerD